MSGRHRDNGRIEGSEQRESRMFGEIKRNSSNEITSVHASTHTHQCAHNFQPTWQRTTHFPQGKKSRSCWRGSLEKTEVPLRVILMLSRNSIWDDSEILKFYSGFQRNLSFTQDPRQIIQFLFRITKRFLSSVQDPREILKVYSEFKVRIPEKSRGFCQDPRLILYFYSEFFPGAQRFRSSIQDPSSGQDLRKIVRMPDN